MLRQVFGKDKIGSIEIKNPKTSMSKLNKMILNYKGNQAKYPERDIEIFIERYGLHGQSPKSPKQICNEGKYGIGRARIDQITKRVARYLRQINIKK